jgi:F0F1-type ATP synthase membrane subunit c/vacuolar-type H+-ATPase subunit K
MKPTNSDKPDIEARYRTLLILWFAICMSVLMFMVVIYLSPVVVAENPKLTLALNSLGLLPVALSFLLKQRALAKSVATQRLDLVQSAYVLSFALCESSALLGLVDHFTTGSRYSYFAFVIAGIGLLLHFPQKQNLVNASSYRQL